ncbi:ATP-binding protein OS=Leifsonia shinshuensis OX=150026 GN=HNR13_000408 PE=4 SV=1 [Leifsonia shinshuensis]
MWVNGPFGGGKTTTVRALLEARPDFSVFDTEWIGAMLEAPLRRKLPVDDFQDWAAWRALVVAALLSIHDAVGGTIVVPQTVLVEEYWDEIVDGLVRGGVGVEAVTLVAGRAELEERIRADTVESSAVEWRLRRLADFEAAEWLTRRTRLVSTVGRSPEQVAGRILDGGLGGAGVRS